MLDNGRSRLVERGELRVKAVQLHQATGLSVRRLLRGRKDAGRVGSISQRDIALSRSA